MPLAQAHPFEPMPVTHEEDMQEVSRPGVGYRDFNGGSYACSSSWRHDVTAV